MCLRCSSLLPRPRLAPPPPPNPASACHISLEVSLSGPHAKRATEVAPWGATWHARRRPPLKSRCSRRTRHTLRPTRRASLATRPAPRGARMWALALGPDNSVPPRSGYMPPASLFSPARGGVELRIATVAMRPHAVQAGLQANAQSRRPAAHGSTWAAEPSQAGHARSGSCPAAPAPRQACAASSSACSAPAPARCARASARADERRGLHARQPRRTPSALPPSAAMPQPVRQCSAWQPPSGPLRHPNASSISCSCLTCASSPGAWTVQMR